MAPDLAHNALSLYLSRPLSRADYIVGKLLVLLVPLSAVTWIPGLLLLGLQTSLAGTGWLSGDWRLVPAVVVGSWIWILLLAVLAIAISAWVKWRPVATGMLFGIFVIGEAFGKAIEEMPVSAGQGLAMDDVVQTIWPTCSVGSTSSAIPSPRILCPLCLLGDAGADLRRSALGAAPESAGLRGVAMSAATESNGAGAPPAAPAALVFEDVSKFYGEVLGVNRVDLAIGPGITSLVGPNGSGKTTLMNLATGLLLPTEGTVSVLGSLPATPSDSSPTWLLHAVRFLSARHQRRDFVHLFLELHGLGRRAQSSSPSGRSTCRAERCRVAADRRLQQGDEAAASSWLRRSPTTRRCCSSRAAERSRSACPSEVIELLRGFAADGRTVVISSHILHEVDELSIVWCWSTVATSWPKAPSPGSRQDVRRATARRPGAVRPAGGARGASLRRGSCRRGADRSGRPGLLVRTKSSEQFYVLLNRLAGEGLVEVEAVVPADEDVQAVYQYLIGTDAGTAS